MLDRSCDQPARDRPRRAKAPARKNIRRVVYAEIDPGCADEEHQDDRYGHDVSLDI